MATPSKALLADLKMKISNFNMLGLASQNQFSSKSIIFLKE